MIDLDEKRCEDPGQAGAKAAWLARGRRAGLPVLPGFVVPSRQSRPAMALGVEVMAQRGSGGARLAMSQLPLDGALESALIAASFPLGDPLVVRSSSILEAGGEWSGAFTSYLDIHPEETPVAVRGCWASAFTVHTLERYEAAGIEPGSVPMAVLVQPALEPEFGGVARLVDDEVNVIGVAGSPAPLVQGWDPGAHARVARNGMIKGDSATSLMGEHIIGAVAEAIRQADHAVGANSCEWAYLDGQVWLLQLGHAVQRSGESVAVPEVFQTAPMHELARLVRRFPGPLGETLVLPWAVGSPGAFLDPVKPADVDPFEALNEAVELSRTLTADVWQGPKATATDRASDVLRALRGDDPDGALGALAGLRPPDDDRATVVLGLLERARSGLVESGLVSRAELGWHIGPTEALATLRSGRADQMKSRIGFDRWEPFDLAAVIGQGRSVEAMPAAPGMAVGRMCFVSDPYHVPHFRPRDVVVGTHPLPNLAALLWDASALITTGGGPAAHLFESALALAIPAVAGVDLEGLLGSDPARLTGEFSLAVDGAQGIVWAAPF